MDYQGNRLAESSHSVNNKIVFTFWKKLHSNGEHKNEWFMKFPKQYRINMMQCTELWSQTDLLRILKSLIRGFMNEGKLSDLFILHILQILNYNNYKVCNV